MIRRLRRPARSRAKTRTQVPTLLGAESSSASSSPVGCPGLAFSNDEVRRTCFLHLLRERLLDPDFRQTEGFAIGEVEDILDLSDPPLFTRSSGPRHTCASPSGRRPPRSGVGPRPLAATDLRAADEACPMGKAIDKMRASGRPQRAAIPRKRE